MALLLAPVPDLEHEGAVMGTSDKIHNKTEEIKGRAKETVGAATGDRGMEHEGHIDQVKGNLRQAGEKLKDAVSD